MTADLGNPYFTHTLNLKSQWRATVGQALSTSQLTHRCFRFWQNEQHSATAIQHFSVELGTQFHNCPGQPTFGTGSFHLTGSQHTNLHHLWRICQHLFGFVAGVQPNSTSRPTEFKPSGKRLHQLFSTLNSSYLGAILPSSGIATYNLYHLWRNDFGGSRLILANIRILNLTRSQRIFQTDRTPQSLSGLSQTHNLTEL